MVDITIYDGSNTIGGSKIHVRENNEGLLLDFGMNFKKHGIYFQEYLSWRASRGIYDLIKLKLIPKLNIYRKDLIPEDLDVSSYPKPKINAILLSHAHMDHFGDIGLLKPDFPIVGSPITISLLKGILDCTRTMPGSELAYMMIKEQMKDGRLMKTQKGHDGLISGRNFYSTKNISDNLNDYMTTPFNPKKKYKPGKIENLENLSLKLDIEAYDVDHSIYGATG